MRIAGLAGLSLLATSGAGAAEEPVYFTPDEAIHECLAEAKRTVEARFSGGASPAGDFVANEIEGGWTVDGAFRVGGADSGRTVPVSCRVTADGAEVTAPAAED